MIRLAIVVTDRKIWTGGYNYLLNLVHTINDVLPKQITPVIFFADNAAPEDVARFASIDCANIVQSPALRHSRRSRSLIYALLWGVDPTIQVIFEKNKIDVVLEVAQFFGWRLRQRTVAWMADFQHRVMKHLFSKRAYLRRELGFRAEIAANRSVILSSEDARSHCEQFYPQTRGRTYVLRFAVPARPRMSVAELHAIRSQYALPEEFFFLPNQFWRHKNHACVIRAIGELRESGRDVVVAASGNPLDRGDPEHWPRLARLIAELGVAGNFRLLGMVPTEHLYALLQSCTAMINPSKFEGWSTTVEEAKSLGTPLILSSIPVHHEQADGVAMFFDPDHYEGLASILSNYKAASPDHRAKLAADACNASAAAVARYALGFLQVLEEVAGKPVSSL
jgi:glycosyltransferase involved in cell wall biosynthesis